MAHRLALQRVPHWRGRLRVLICQGIQKPPTPENSSVVSIHTDDVTCALPSQKGSGSSVNSTNVDITSIALAEGSYVFYAKAVDPAGNASACSTATVSYVRDITAPTGNSISIAAAATYTNVAAPALTLASTGASESRIKSNGYIHV